MKVLLVRIVLVLILGMALSRRFGLSDGSRWYKVWERACCQGERNLECEFDEEFWGFGERGGDLGRMGLWVLREDVV